MGGEVLELELEPIEQKPFVIESLQASCLQVDALLWSLRALKLADSKHMSLESDEDRAYMGVSKTKILGLMREQVRPLCNGVAPPSLAGMVEQLPHIEARLSNIKLPPCPSDRTIDAVTRNCELEPNERTLLRFKAACNISTLLSMVFHQFFENLSVREFLEVSSTVLQMELPALRAALNPDRFLSRSRLMKLRYRSRDPFGDGGSGCLSLLPGVMQLFETADGDYGRLVRTMALPSPEQGLSARDFSYMEKEWSLALGYLQGSLKGQHKGANILLHGLPGVGKTEFARALARAVNANGFEIKSANLDHSVLGPDDRRDRYFLAGELLPKNSKTVLVFDDADGSLGINSRRVDELKSSKAAINQMLENNPFPTIWLMNTTDDLEPAVLRRFDINIPYRRPPASVIRRLLKKTLPRQAVSESWLQRVSSSQAVTPAIVDRLGRIAERISDVDNVQHTLDTSLELSRISVARNAGRAFNRQYCNAEPGIDAICGYLKNSTSSRLLLHGPTGTGKTALAKHLAQSSDLQPRLIRPSDVLGSYVGQTERNIARLFEETDPLEQLIILDEFESLAEDRRRSVRSWEVSKVAEFLSRVDEYKGRIIACTNLPDNVDTAVRRRFHLKARLNPLTCQQRIDVVREFADELGCKLPQNIGAFTDELDGLAFGHVANAVEVGRYTDQVDWAQFLQFVRAEMLGTEGKVQRRIGFVNRGAA